VAFPASAAQRCGEAFHGKEAAAADRPRGSVERWPGVSDWPGGDPMNRRSIAQRLYPDMHSKDAKPTPAVDVTAPHVDQQHVDAKTGKIFTVKAKPVTAQKNGLLLS
jgi:hypothetical protein